MKLRVTVNEKSYDVEVEILEEEWPVRLEPAPLTAVGGARPLSVPSAAPPATTPPGARELKAPIPGTVLEVRAAAGQPVASGDTLIVLDAMKMNIPIPAPLSGTIKEIRVQAGDAVSMGQVMVTFE